MGDSFRRSGYYGREPQFKIDWANVIFWIAMVILCLAFWGALLHYLGVFRWLHGVMTRKVELRISLSDLAFVSPLAIYAGCLLRRREKFKKTHNIRW